MKAKVDREGRQPLHYAAMANRITEIEERLAEGDDPNLGDRLGFTPLRLALQEGSADAARVLLDYGTEVDRVNSFSNTPLSVAVFKSQGRGDLIALLRGRVPIRYMLSQQRRPNACRAGASYWQL
jgi:ankyrin repeat protein